jgi:hypothetical protein
MAISKHLVKVYGTFIGFLVGFHILSYLGSIIYKSPIYFKNLIDEKTNNVVVSDNVNILEVLDHSLSPPLLMYSSIKEIPQSRIVSYGYSIISILSKVVILSIIIWIIVSKEPSTKKLLQKVFTPQVIR